MKNIITIGGSNSKKSINKTLAEYAAKQLKNVELKNIDLNDFQLPLYGIDLEETEGLHSEAIRLNAIFDTADGFVVSLAEHNGSYSVAFKNAFDWLSRVNPKVWRNKPVLVLSTSPGGRGGATILNSAVGTFPHLGAKVTGSFAFPSFYDNFQNDEIVNQELKEQLIREIAILQKEIE